MFELTKGSDNFIDQLADIPREELFSVGEVVGSIPAWVPPTIALAYQRTRRHQGEDYTAAWAMELMLGSDGMDALLGAQLDDDTFDKIVTIIIGRVRGATRAAGPLLGKASSNGSTSGKPPARRARSAATKK